MQCVIEQQSAAQANRQRWLQDQAEAEARAALTAGLQQSIRAKRVAKLKGLFSEPLKTQGTIRGTSLAATAAAHLLTACNGPA